MDFLFLSSLYWCVDVGLWEMGSRLNLLVYGRLLLAAGKNLLLVGAPGVGKTRFALRVSWSRLDPIVVVGREGLTFDYLMLHYVFDGGVVREVLGDLAKAIVSSWISIELGLGPKNIVFDEINRCNIDFLLGELFTAMDLEHRMRVPVLRGRVFKYVEQLLGSGDPARIMEELGLHNINVNDLENAVKALLEKSKAFGGLPLPYSFRIIATMNMYDRAQLYRLGYALQRRFAFLYMSMPFEEYNVNYSLEGPDVGSRVPERSRRIYEKVYRALADEKSIIVNEALSELLIHERVHKSLSDKDYPTLISVGYEDIVGAVKDAIREYDSISKIVAYTFAVARSMGVELGASLLVDIVKLYTLSSALGLEGKPLVDNASMADLVLSSLIIPSMSVVFPRIRSEILLDLRRTLNLLLEYIDMIEGILGEHSLSKYMLEGYMLELPASMRS